MLSDDTLGSPVLRRVLAGWSVAIPPWLRHDSRDLRRSSRCFWTAGADAVKGQKTQIVQPCNTLDDFLP